MQEQVNAWIRKKKKQFQNKSVFAKWFDLRLSGSYPDNYYEKTGYNMFYE